jgi:CheY-like chemotaxis protein
MSEVTTFGRKAEKLARNPLGIIALFIVLIYGFAAMVITFGDALTADQKTPLIYFLVGFPVLVLGVFAWLVSRHSGKLFAPSDYRDEENYLKALTATASLAVAATKSASNPSEADVGAIVASVRESVRSSPPTSAIYAARNLLWVDDMPDNNDNERRAFEAVGFDVALASSTDEALELLGQQDFAALISDMVRAEGAEEGFVLLETLRAQRSPVPYFVYTGPPATEYAEEVARRGGQGCYDTPQELFLAVLRASRGGRPATAPPPLRSDR